MAGSRLPVALASGPELVPSSVKAEAAYRERTYGIVTPEACSVCGDTGYLRCDAQPGERGFGTMTPCNVCNGDSWYRYVTANCGLEESELGCRLLDWRLGNWRDGNKRQQRQNAKDAIEEAIDQRRGWLTFWGDFGAGKTFALKIIVNELRIDQVECLYVPFAVVLDHLRSLMGQGIESSRYWERVLSVPILALDEVTRFYDTGWARERLHVLADTRYRRWQSCLTVFATNDDPREALPPADAIGYLYSRMRQGRLVELRGDVRPAAGGHSATGGRVGAEKEKIGGGR